MGVERREHILGELGRLGGDRREGAHMVQAMHETLTGAVSIPACPPYGCGGIT